MKIVLIPNLPYTLRDHKRFGAEYFISKGYKVEVMDIHNVLLPGYKEKVNIDYYSFEEHWEPNDKKEIFDRIDTLSSKDLIFFYIAGRESVNLLNEMKKYTKARFVTYVSGSIPPTTVFCNPILLFKRYVKNFIKKFMPRYKLFFPSDFYISGSPKDEELFPYFISKNTKLIKSNSRDYNKCLLSKPYNFSEKYCVFLDTDVIDAADYEIFKNKAKRNKKEYLNKLISFLKWIKKEYKLNVIIAPHPKSRIYKDMDNIDGIKIIRNKSVELVQGSEFVVNEGTAAVSFAVYFNKPIIFFTFHEIAFFYNHCCSFTKELNKEIINIDVLSKHQFDIELKNNRMYKDYKFKYLTYNDDKIDTYKMIEKNILEKV